MKPTTELDLALAHLLRLRAAIATAEESRDLQRLLVGGALAKTDASLLRSRRIARDVALKASRLSRDAGLPDQALELAREYAQLDHLVRSQEERAGAA